jgi:hypothetical protein
MAAHVFHFPEEYESEAPIIESKGWMIGTLELSDGRKYTLCFSCPTRLQQDVEAELSFQPAYVQRNLVVVPAVTRAHVLNAVQWLVDGNGLEDFVPG